LEYTKGALSDIQKEPVKTEKKKSTQPQDPVTSQVEDKFDEWLKKDKKPTSES
jgi:hypothetical protein